MKKILFNGIDREIPNKSPKVVYNPIRQDEFEQLIFAPDPATGNPCGSLAYLAKGSDEISSYIREHFIGNSQATGTSGVEDADFALKLCPNGQERNAEYMQRVSELIAEQFNVNKNED